MQRPHLTRVNGLAQAALSPEDRGLMYGDGVFRTLRVRGGQPQWWQAHMRKLAEDAERLAIPPPPVSLWECEVADLLAEAPAECVLKLVLTRGVGARGYRPAAQQPPTRIVQVAAWPDHIERVAARGARLALCELRLAEQPLLAGIKHLNRLENVLAALALDGSQADEGLLLDTSGRVICGISSNVFIYRRGTLLTPRLARCGVAGVARRCVMEQAARSGLLVQEADFGLDELLGADEVFLTNSLIRIWPVTGLGERTWAVLRLARQLRSLLDDAA